MAVNKQILIGNLGQDPEVRYTQSGTAVCNLRLAVSERVKKAGNWEDHTEWFTVVCFGKMADNAAEYLEKGRQIYVEGPSRFREYQKRDGTPGYSREIVAIQLKYLGGGGNKGGSKGGGRGRGNGGRGNQQKPPENNDDGFYDDDLPF